MRPIVIAYHLVWTGYGWWLFTDPRGSMSSVLRNEYLRDTGEMHFGRKRIQPRSSEVREHFRTTESKLAHARRTFSDVEIDCIGSAFARVVTECVYTVYACAIMMDHIHLLIRKHRHSAEDMIANFQRESHLALRDARHFDLEHPVWGGHGWTVFIDNPERVWKTIDYVRENPIKARMREQNWSFVKPYDNWPLFEGHSPNSPYARRMKRRET